MGLLDRKTMLIRQKLGIEKVDLGEDEFVYVRQMTGRERDIFEQSLVKEIRDGDGKIERYERSMEDFRAKLVVCVVCDENGDLLLKPEDYPLLSQSMSAKRLEKIVEAAQTINKISDDDKKALVKNSEAGQDDNSNSGSVES